MEDLIQLLADKKRLPYHKKCEWVIIYINIIEGIFNKILYFFSWKQLFGNVFKCAAPNDVL